ncbi:MAG: hypothetical protein Q9191_003491 [Dirinaria sp. TL-2023a]
MPPVVRGQKDALSTVNAVANGKQQRSILTYGKISKAQAASPILGKRKVAEDAEGIGCDPRSKRRKAESVKEYRPQDEDLVDPNAISEPSRPFVNDTPPRKSSQAEPCQSSLPSQAFKPTPNRKVLGAAVAETPTKGARSILESFSIQSSPPSTRSSSPTQPRLSSPPTSPSSFRSSSPVCSDCEDLPEALQDLIRLHSSFLSALSLHYAHHGVFTPVDLRVLNVSIERIWRKRRVHNDDIQKILGLTHIPRSSGQKLRGACSLRLLDYGYGRICVELAEDLEKRVLHKRPFDEESCQSEFHGLLERRWNRYAGKESISNSAEEFLADLPTLPINPCDSLSRLTPLLAKGQGRLEDLKSSAVQAQKSLSFSDSTISAKGAPNTGARLTNSRNKSLLSRIRAKELVQSTLPPPPTAATVAKKSALRRIEDITPVLEMLTSSSNGESCKVESRISKPQQQAQSKSFTMPTIVQNLQMSLRNPISKEEAVTSVRTLSELCPEWIGLNVLGKCVSVTVRKSEAVGKEEIGRRVRELLQSL